MKSTTEKLQKVSRMIFEADSSYVDSTLTLYKSCLTELDSVNTHANVISTHLVLYSAYLTQYQLLTLIKSNNNCF